MIFSGALYDTEIFPRKFQKDTRKSIILYKSATRA